MDSFITEVTLETYPKGWLDEHDEEIEVEVEFSYEECELVVRLERWCWGEDSYYVSIKSVTPVTVNKELGSEITELLSTSTMDWLEELAREEIQ